MTPAIKLLQRKKIPFTVHEFGHDPSASSYGEEAASKLNVPAEQVFKTLVAQLSDDRLAVALVPVSAMLDTKKLALVCSTKKAAMAERDAISRLTGYLPGAVSPLAQRQQLFTVIDEQAKAFTAMYVSAGKRGVDICLAPEDLLALTHGVYAAISK